MGGALRERKVQSTTQSATACGYRRATGVRKGDGTGTAHTNTHRGTHVFSPFCRPSCLHHCRNSANQLRCSEPTCQHLSLPTHTLQHCSTEVLNTYVYLVHHTQTHTHTHQGHIVHCSTSCFFFPTQRLHGPKTARWRCTYRPCLSLRSQAQGSLESVPRLTYSNTCDPARPPAESQRSITSQILLPRKGRVKKKKKSTQAADQSSAALPLLTRCLQHGMSASRSWDRCGLVGRAWREQSSRHYIADLLS